MFKKPEFFLHLLSLVRKMLVMGMSDIGKDADCGTDHWFNKLHLPGQRNAGFKNSQVMFRAHLPYRKWHPDLRIVTFRTADDLVIGIEQLKQPLLHDRFPVAAGNANHRNIELPAMKGSQLLQCDQSIFDQNKDGARKLVIGHW